MFRRLDSLSLSGGFLGELIGFTSYFCDTNDIANIYFTRLIYLHIWGMAMVETKHVFSGIVGSA